MENNRMFYSKNVFSSPEKIKDICLYDTTLFFSKNKTIFQKNTGFKEFQYDIESFTFNFDGTLCFVLFTNNLLNKYTLETPWYIASIKITNEHLTVWNYKSVEYTEINGKTILVCTSQHHICFYDISNWNNKILLSRQNHLCNCSEQSLSIDTNNLILYLLNTESNIVVSFKILETYEVLYKTWFFMGSDYESNAICFNRINKLYFCSKNNSNNFFILEFKIQPPEPILPPPPHLIIKRMDNIYQVYDDSSLKAGFSGLYSNIINTLVLWDNNYSTPSYDMNITLKDTSSVQFSHIMSFDNIIVLINQDFTLSLQDNNTVLGTSFEKFMPGQMNTISIKRSENLLNYQVFLNNSLVINYSFTQTNNQTICVYTYLRDNNNFEVEQITQN